MSSSQFFCCPRFCPTRVSYCTVHSLFCPNETEFYVFTPKQLYLHCFQLIKWDGHEKRFTGGKDTSHLYLWIFAETFSMFFFFSNFQITHQDLKSCDSLTAGIPNFAIFPEIKMLHWIEGKNSCQTQIAGFPESKFAQDSSISYFFFFLRKMQSNKGAYRRRGSAGITWWLYERWSPHEGAWGLTDRWPVHCGWAGSLCPRQWRHDDKGSNRLLCFAARGLKRKWENETHVAGSCRHSSTGTASSERRRSYPSGWSPAGSTTCPCPLSSGTRRRTRQDPCCRR